jgi:hypothetical protein
MPARLPRVAIFTNLTNGYHHLALESLRSGADMLHVSLALYEVHDMTTLASAFDEQLKAEGHEAGRLTRAAADEVRSCNQSQDRQNPWPYRADHGTRARRRSDRINASFCPGTLSVQVRCCTRSRLLLAQSRQGRSLIFGRQPSEGQLTSFAAVIAVMERSEHDPELPSGLGTRAF